jgi:hypothetical protein
MLDCYLFGGSFRPPNDICCGNCIGHQFVKAARKSHQERTGEGTDLIAFYNLHIAGNDLTARIRVNRHWADMGF